MINAALTRLCPAAPPYLPSTYSGRQELYLFLLFLDLLSSWLDEQVG